MADNNETARLGDILRKKTQAEVNRRVAERETARKLREEPFIKEAQDFLSTLPTELQQAAEEECQEQKLLNFVDIAEVMSIEFKQLESDSHDRHNPAFEVSFERLAKETFNFCRTGGGLKLIEDYCREQGIICEPRLDVEGTKSAKIRIRFSWPASSQNEPEPRD